MAPLQQQHLTKYPIGREKLKKYYLGNNNDGDMRSSAEHKIKNVPKYVTKLHRKTHIFALIISAHNLSVKAKKAVPAG